MDMISYTIISLIPPPFYDQIWKMKQHFNLFIDQKKTQDKTVIALNEAHVTLKRRFFLSSLDQEPLLLADLTQLKTTPIQISANSTKIFHSETMNNVLIANIEHQDSLSLLHNDIATIVAKYSVDKATFEYEQYNPHISLVYKLPEEKIAEAEKYANENILPINFTLVNFVLLKNIDGIKMEREIVKEFTL